MKKTPSYLKGLAETRARAAGDLERAERLLTEVQHTIETARRELEACDRLITKYDGRIDPTRIPAIRATKGRYGSYGALNASIERYLREEAPRDVGTFELAVALQHEFQLEFASGSERAKWVQNSMTRGLKKLVEAGVVERLHELVGSPEGRWRWSQSGGASSLSALRDQAASAGVAVDDGLAELDGVED